MNRQPEIMRFLRSAMRTCFGVWMVVTLPLCGALASDSYDWQAIEPADLIAPTPPFTSNQYRLIESSTDSITVAFAWPEGARPEPQSVDRYRFVLVIPPAGIGSVTYTTTARTFYANGETIDPATIPAEPPPTTRFTHQVLGEYRGAKVCALEFRPILPVSGASEAQHSYISNSTLTIRLASPFHAPRVAHEIVNRAFAAFVLNANDLPRCLPPVAPEKVDPLAERLWSLPALRIRTSAPGWHAIPARRILAEWREQVRIEDIQLARRASLIEVPSEYQQADHGLRRVDTSEPTIVISASGEWKDSGPIAPDDLVLFHAELSVAPGDPRECYWLVVDPEADSSKSQIRVQEEAGGEFITSATSGWITERIGPDLLFVDGGLRTEQQASFWAAQMFPGPATGSVAVQLPESIREALDGSEGFFTLIFGSALKDRYSPGYRIRPPDVAVQIDGSTVPVRLNKGSSEYATEFRFPIPSGIQSVTAEISHVPTGKPSNPLYLDEVRLSIHRSLVWSGSPAVYSWPTARDGSLSISLRSTTPLLAVVKDVSGEWTFLAPSQADSVATLVPATPILELHLLPVDGWNSPDTITRYDRPEWMTRFPRAEKLFIGPESFQQEGVLLIGESRTDQAEAAWIDIQSLFDVFTGGQFSPHAVRHFLSWVVLAQSDPQPHSVVLVGDSSWDTWGRYPHSGEIPHWTPAYHAEDRPDFPSDHWFIEGILADRVGDWFLGRIPCQTSAQLQTYIGKIREFRRITRTQPLEHLFWVTDDNPPFAKNKQIVYGASLPGALEPRLLDVRDFPFVDNFYYGIHLRRIQEEARKGLDALDYGKISPAANQAIRDGISAGPSLFIYYGHSGLNVLGHERLLFGGGSKFSDVPSLANGGRAPLALLMTCDVGRFDFAETPKWSVGLAEEMLFHGLGGCLALVTSTGRGLPDDHLDLMRGFMDGMFNHRLSESGAALWAGKVQCLIPGRANEAIDMFTLLGDPLFRPSIPAAAEVSPSSLRWQEDGSIEIRLDSHYSDQARFWVIDERVERVAQIPGDASQEREGTVLSYAEAEDISTLHVGVVDSGKAGGASLDLSRFTRPIWSGEISEGSPNLTLVPGQVIFENYSPRSGETLFLTATVANAGPGIAENVAVSAYEVPSEAADASLLTATDLVPFTQFAEFPDPVIRRIRPGEMKSVRLRWDRWEGIGQRNILVRVDPEDRVRESDESDNAAFKKIRILDKPDLAWGVVRDSTAGAVDFSRAKSVDAKWVTHPEQVNLGGFSPLQGLLASVDRAVIVPIPLTNFGETPSDPCLVQYTYRGEDGAPIVEPFSFAIPTIPPSLGDISPRAIPVLLLPGVKEIEIIADFDDEVDEITTDNNRIRLVLPIRFWDRYPSLAPKRVPPKALERIQLE